MKHINYIEMGLNAEVREALAHPDFTGYGISDFVMNWTLTRYIGLEIGIIYEGHSSEPLNVFEEWNNTTMMDMFTDISGVEWI